MKMPNTCMIVLLLLFGMQSLQSFGADKPAPQSDDAKKKKLRVVMTTDFPPIGVVKEGKVPNDQKSDPDDMQSMVRFLLYANEFDIEALVATSGTFANKAKKQNILDVIDRYEKVYDNLKKHDPAYPTPKHLRSVTFQGLRRNLGQEGHRKHRQGQGQQGVRRTHRDRGQARSATGLRWRLGRLQRRGAGGLEGAEHSHPGRTGHLPRQAAHPSDRDSGRDNWLVARDVPEAVHHSLGKDVSGDVRWP